MSRVDQWTKTALTRLRGPNVVADAHGVPVELVAFERITQIRLETLEVDESAYRTFVDRYFPDWQSRFGHVQHKKLLEFYLSYTLLDPSESDVFLDAAGGVDSYLPNLPCRRRYLQDIRITDALRQRLGPSIEYVESGADAIPLANGSVDKISVHHSFEHFQAQADVGFLTEVQRLLSPGGRCCIVPLFVGLEYVELTDSFRGPPGFDPAALRIRDPTATLPGGEACGHFARVYDLSAFVRRVIGSIDTASFSVRLVEAVSRDRSLPDPSIPTHRSVARINFPYRALVVEHLPAH